MSDQRYPLSWPAGWIRTQPGQRRRAKFKSGRQSVTVATAGDRLVAELDRLGATSAILSTDVELAAHGKPRSSQPDPKDPGAAVYFKLKGKPRCLAVDKWDRVADNIAAIANHIDALRRIDRYGVGTIEQAFAGYQALPAQAASWFTVLEFTEPPTKWATIEARYLELAKRHHPDKPGGSHDVFSKITAAYATAKEEFGVK